MYGATSVQIRGPSFQLTKIVKKVATMPTELVARVTVR